MIRKIHNSPALIALLVCGLAISYASQEPSRYDPAWLGLCVFLFFGGCALSFDIIRARPQPRLKIAMSRAAWRRAKRGLMLGVACLVLALGWVLWGLGVFDAGAWPGIALVFAPALLFGFPGAMLVYYWLGLWAFGEIHDEPKE